MEIEELKLAWQALDRRLERQYAVNLQLFRDTRLDRARHGLRPLVVGQAIQAVLGIVVAGAAAIFWTMHLYVVHLLVCGLLVHLYGLLLVIFATRNLYLIHRIDYTAPVLDIQRRLAELRAWRVRIEAPTNMVLGCFIWIPVLWMNLAWYGIDLWSPAFIRWGVSSGAVGLAACAVVVWLMRRAGMTRKIEDHAAGSGVQKVEAALEEITRFEQD